MSAEVRVNDESERPLPKILDDALFNVEREHPQDTVNNRLYQARGLATLLYGEGLEVLTNLRADLQDGVLWTLASLIDDAYVAAQRIGRAPTRGSKP